MFTNSDQILATHVKKPKTHFPKRHVNKKHRRPTATRKHGLGLPILIKYSQVLTNIDHYGLVYPIGINSIHYIDSLFPIGHSLFSILYCLFPDIQIPLI